MGFLLLPLVGKTGGHLGPMMDQGWHTFTANCDDLPSKMPDQNGDIPFAALAVKTRLGGWDLVHKSLSL
jgi:hypothetical protein